jgi:hypothetical protein
MGRGIDGKKIFINRKDREDFLERLADLCPEWSDDWLGYNFLAGEDFQHVVRSSNDLKLVHLVAALLKRWLLGTY